MAKFFEHYLEFLEEIRKVVINEMEPDDRCRFTRCSSLCRREAQKCKNYIYGMKFNVYSQNDMTFRVFYHEKHKNDLHGDYNVSFTLAHGNNIVYSNRLGVELWRTQLERSINIMEYACENVKYMLNIYQKTIKKLSLVGKGNYDFGIRSLSNLESLTLGVDTDILRIMSEIRKPLKEFVCYQSMSKSFTRDCEQIYEVENLFEVYKMDINYEQFQKLSAQRIHMNIGHLAEENISDFIQSWQNDKLRNNFISCRWNINGSRFDVQKLFRFLGIHQDVGRPWTIIDIGHNKDATKKAKLVFDFVKLEFRVLIQ